MNKRIATLRLAYVAIFIGIGVLDFLWINRANQTYAKEYLNESIALSAGTYATCRLINGGVSAIQESSISISPWGIGLEFEAGQVLDPINDATERLSDACVKSMALLGVQRLLLAAVNTYTIVPFYVLLALFLVCMSLPKARGLTTFMGRAAFLILLVRLSTPLLCYVGTEVNRNYFTPQIEAEQSRLAEVKKIAMAEFDAEVPTLTSENNPAEGKLDAIVQFFTDFRDRIAAISAAISHRAKSLARALAYMKDNFPDITTSLASLFALVIEKVIVQVFLLPLGILFGLKKIFSSLSGEGFDNFIERMKRLQQAESTVPVKAAPSASSSVR